VRRRKFIALSGAAVVSWPVAVRAQQPTMPVVGLLAAPAPASYMRYAAAFLQGLKETGFVEGENVAIELRWAEGHYDRLPAMAAELVAHKAAVIATIGGVPAALAAEAATSTIPIVFALADDPVKLGLVESIARPNGNATGISFLAVGLESKRLELLREAMPNTSTVAVLLNPKNPETENQIPEIRNAASVLGVKLTILNASAEAEIDTAFAAAAQQHFDALTIGADSFLFSRRDQLVSLATRYALPTIYPFREEAVAGGLMSYGTDLADAYRQEGNYVGRILKGAKPDDLPVQQSVKVELILNLKTAKTLGVSFPLALLGRADEVIE
jgi:putative tryptophan/tyrosine transport system substrate-binding protein